MGLRPLREGIGISQEYGTNPGGFNPAGGHTGRDWAAPQGEKLVAIADGVVRFAGFCHDLPGGPNGWAQRWFLSLTFGGIVVVVEHDDVWAIYAHLSRTDLNAGDHVRQGDLVGYSGDTGGASTGPHLHFEILPRTPNYASSTYGRVFPGPYVTQPYRLNSGTAPARPAPVPRNTRNGIDVSGWQPENIGKLVPADFVIVKATQGVGYVNPNMARQVELARAQGKPVGLYHYAEADSDSAAEARYFLRVAKPYLDAGAVPFLDWENADNKPGVPAWKLTRTAYTQWAEDWTRDVEKATGTTVGLYMTKATADLPTWSAWAKKHPLWLAYYGYETVFNGYATSFSPPPVNGWNVAVWQYSQFGRLPGYAGDLDLNVYFGGISRWDKPTGAATTGKDWFSMATEKDLENAVWRVLNRAFPMQGGQKGTTSLVREAAWNRTNFQQVRSLVAGVPKGVLTTTVKRSNGTGNATLGQNVSYDNENWAGARASDAALKAQNERIIQQNDQIIAALETLAGAIGAQPSTDNTEGK